MAFIYCKKCGEHTHLTPHAFWNINDLGVKCKNCGTINTITMENGDSKNKRSHNPYWDNLLSLTNSKYSQNNKI